MTIHINSMILRYTCVLCGWVSVAITKNRGSVDCVAEDRRVLGITGGWSTATLDPGAWYSTVCEGGWARVGLWPRG